MSALFRRLGPSWMGLLAACALESHPPPGAHAPDGWIPSTDGDLEAVRRHFGIGRTRLLGHSWGGLLAAGYAREHPERVATLVLANPAPARRSPYMQQLGPKLRAWMDSATVAEWRELAAARVDPTRDPRATSLDYWRMYIRGYFADPADTLTILRMRGDFCTASGPSLLNGRLVNSLTMASLGDWDWRDELGGVEVPVLIVTGTGDTMPLDSMAEWEAAFPAARIVVLEGTGHYPHVERPEEYFSVVGSFLR